MFANVLMVQEEKGAPGAEDDAISGNTSKDVKFLYLKIKQDGATKPLKASRTGPKSGFPCRAYHRIHCEVNSFLDF